MPTQKGGGGGGGKDVRAGGAFFELFAKDNLSHVLDKMQRKALAFSSMMKRAGNASLLAGAGLAAPLVALFKGGMDRAADVGRMSQQFGIPVELMSRLQYAAEQAGVSVDEVMKDTSGRFSELVAKAPAISGEDAAQALQIQREFADATTALQSAMMPLLTTVTPLVKQVADFVKENAHAIRIIVPLAAGLVAFGFAAKITAIAVTGLVIAVKAVGIALAAIASPVGIIVGIMGALTYVMVTQTAAGREFGAMVRGGLVGALDVLKETWQGVGDALAKGDFLLAGKVAFAGLKVLFFEFISVATTWWTAFKMVFVDTWHTMTLGAGLAWNDFAAGMEMAFQFHINAIINALHYMGRIALDVAIKAAESIDSLDPTSSLAGAIARAKALRDGLGGVDMRAGMDDIAKRRAEKERGMVAEFEMAKKARDAARAEDVAAADDRVKKAKAELDALRAEAAKPGEIKADKLTPLADGLKAAEAVKGTFSGAALGQAFGVSSNAQKQTELMKGIRQNTEDTAKGLKDLNRGK